MASCSQNNGIRFEAHIWPSQKIELGWVSKTDDGHGGCKDTVYGARVGLIVISPEMEELRGLELGLANAGGSVTGLQLGLFNYAKVLKGLQIGLLTNRTDILQGVQASFLANDILQGARASGVEESYVLHNASCGVQVSLLINMAEALSGMQVSGVFNASRHISGAQIGTVNIINKSLWMFFNASAW